MAVIEFLGTDNHVLIDNTYQNLVFAQKQIIAFPSNPPTQIQGSFATVNFTSNNSEFPMLALNSSFAVCVGAMQKTATGFSWTLQCAASGRGLSLEAFIFYLPKNVPNANGIIQIFSETTPQYLVFDSALKYMKVEKLFPFTLDGNLTTAVISSRKFAAVSSKTPGSFYAQQYPPLTRPPLYGVVESIDRSGFKMTPGLISTEKFLYSYRTYATTQPPTVEYENLDGLLLIIDVTGL